jgi:hypothetical protein
VKSFSGRPGERNHLEDLGVGGRVMLKLILAPSSRKCTIVPVIQLV